MGLMETEKTSRVFFFFGMPEMPSTLFANYDEDKAVTHEVVAFTFHLTAAARTGLEI